MNDELLLQQLDETIALPNAPRPASPLQSGDGLHARIWDTERTQHIVWEQPTQARFVVSRGGERSSWKPYFQALINVSVVGAFIALLVFWPRSAPLKAPQVALQAEEIPQQPFAPSVAAANGTYAPTAYSPFRSGASSRPAYSSHVVVASHSGVFNGYHSTSLSVAQMPGYSVAPAAPVGGSRPIIRYDY